MSPEPAVSVQAEPAFPDQVDERARLVSMILWIALAAWMSDLAVVSIALSLMIALALAAGPRAILIRIGALTAALLPAWIVLPLFGPGEKLVELGPAAIYREGVLAACLLQARASLVIAAVTFHAGRTPWNRWVWAAGRLGAPASLLSLMTVTLRYLPVLSGEARRLTTAARARGFEPSARPRGYRTLAAMLGWGFVRSWLRSERLWRAMLSRGYSGGFNHMGEKRGAGVLFLAVSSALAALAAFAAGGIAP